MVATAKWFQQAVTSSFRGVFGPQLPQKPWLTETRHSPKKDPSTPRAGGRERRRREHWKTPADQGLALGFGVSPSRCRTQGEREREMIQSVSVMTWWVSLASAS